MSPFSLRRPAPFALPTLPLSKNGGDEENRTPDPLLARQVLSHLSYTPTFTGFQAVASII